MSIRRLVAFFRPTIPWLLFFITVGILKSIFPAVFNVKVVGSLVMPSLMTLSVFVSRRLVDKRTIKSLGLRRFRYQWVDIVLGVGIIFVATVVVFLANWAVGWINPKSISSVFENVTVFVALGTASTTLISGLLTGWTEELIFRGYMFKNLTWSTNMIIGAFITSVLFGLFHIYNFPQITLTNPDRVSIWVDTGFGGLLLVFAYIRTRNLWLSIGLHAGWNSLMGNIMRLGIPQASRPVVISNLFNAPTHPMNVNDIAIVGIAAVLVYLLTVERNSRGFRKGIAK